MDEPLSPHFTSPPVYSQKFSSSPSTASPNENGQTINNSSLNGKVILAAREGKVERTLSQEGMGQNGFASPRPGWQNGRILNQQVDGVSLPPAGNGESPQSSHVHNVEGRRKMENKAWGAQENVADLCRQSERMNAHGAGQQPQHHLQERFNDSMPRASSVRPSSTGLTRNTVQANNYTSRWSTFSPTSMSRASQSPTRGASVNYSPKMVTGQSNSLMLQQAQAHMAQAQ
ncbi:uncharacterized protein [Physcomitrium patens]|uniref:Uncharacterized protein n=1 Tax=Physcomitrium patens TaxID=3218 RepID=A0A2K1JIX0_PHYPA|nr:uncharacterized protein LOC112291108 [Physcomitrium patens]XP_024393887.1 uncharacterized protein LOC112291108 [Physcomitrium patens]XP_024393888.1 uncharacterized protein LOC112291108 [Physcomitrium patens]XP_024393889.1 uncharacterized protein LOC112291108 [Physcomitrium patens]XP_024393890.1 uncharacterized protein LOC112291108 [Physcomitrium patens]XP_024393891.1 uncharacterized protein LOC112291108 [Physcomitrium patens]XP_024393893.1 uncharacterized protein LOC112291108 [Physcomitriu|eukprot:XP_024393886.1 uncharacterized protein LOC112291108 [Physcomitrella patens]